MKPECVRRASTAEAIVITSIPRNVPHQARTRDQPFEALIVYDTPNRIMVPVTEAKPDGPAK